MLEVITKNTEYSIEFIVDIDENTVKDLTDFTPLIQFRPYADSPIVLASYDINSPYITFTPFLGYVKLSLPPSVTGAFTFKKAVMDLLVTKEDDTDGDRSALIDIVVHTGVSRST
jgi:hypothetical protein